MSSFSRFAIFAGIVSSILFASCTSVSRDELAKKYEKLAALPPATAYACPGDKNIEDLGIAVAELRNTTHKFMREYVAATENHREYLGFINDVNYFITAENMDEQAAWEHVAKLIQEEDAKVTDPAEKKWPRVVEGCNAVYALKPEQKLKDLLPLAASIAQCTVNAGKLKSSLIRFDSNIIAKAQIVKNILVQAKEASECTMFIIEQYKRAQASQNYAK